MEREVTSPHTLVQPDGLAPGHGFSHTVVANTGKTVWVAGEIGIDPPQLRLFFPVLGVVVASSMLAVWLLREPIRPPGTVGFSWRQVLRALGNPRLWSVTCFRRIHFAPMMYRHITIMKTRIRSTNCTTGEAPTTSSHGFSCSGALA